MSNKTEAGSLVGSVFNEMYRIQRQIGTGGMGAVYEAVHTRLHNKKFAIKMLHASIASDAEVFQRFRREAEIASAIGHPNIVEVTDFNITPDGAPYMVMELLDGEDLASRLQKRGPMHLDAAARVIVEVCSALDAAHRAGVVHRDLKPQNIFLCKKLGRDDFVKIVDFGISKVKDSSSLVTRDHSLMGTPFYMSPEQADGLVQQIDFRTDIFALGAIIWEMLTGRMAFEAPTISGAMYKVVHVDPQEVHTLRPDVHPAVSLVLRRAMTKDKNYRYGSVLELAQEFGNACRGISPSMMPPPMRVSTVAPQPMPMVRPQSPAPVPGADPFGATGYVTPAPNQPFPMTTPPPQEMQQPFPQTPVPMLPQPFQQYPATAMPPHLQPGVPQPGMPQMMPPSMPPQQMLGTGPGMPMTPPHPMPMSTPAPMTPAPVGPPQSAMPMPTPMTAKKGKGVLIGAIVGIVAVGGAGAFFALKKGDKPSPSPGPDPQQHHVLVDPHANDPKTPPDAGQAVVAVVTPDAAPPVMQVTAPVVDDVTITVDVTFDKPPPKGVTPKIAVNGKLIDGTTYKTKKGTGKLKLDIVAPGYHGDTQTVVPDGDKTVASVLKKKTGGGGGGDTGIGWVP